MYKKDLEKEIESETSNDFEKLLKALLHVNIYVIGHRLWLNYNQRIWSTMNEILRLTFACV